MPVILKLDTKPSFNEPNVVEIDGKKLTVREITLGDLEKVQALTGDLAAGSAAALRKTLATWLEGDTKVLEKLPLTKIKKLVEVVIQGAFEVPDEVKKGPGPGSDSQAS